MLWGVLMQLICQINLSNISVLIGWLVGSFLFCFCVLGGFGRGEAGSLHLEVILHYEGGRRGRKHVTYLDSDYLLNVLANGIGYSHCDVITEVFVL